MYVCRGINFTSLLFMNVYRIYILLAWYDKKGEIFFWVYLCPFVDDLTKRGEKFGVLYMHVYVIYMHVCFFNWYQSIIVLFMQNGEKYSSFMHICVIWFMHSLNIIIVYYYAWVKGELLWSLTLIHAYITPWVFSSSKRGRCWPRGPLL